MSLPPREPRATLVIRMFGSFELLADGRPISPTKFGSRKARLLLRWLADSRNDVIPEDVLLEALWPDSPAAVAIRSLRVRVSELRKGLSGFVADGAAAHLLERLDKGYRLRTAPGVLSTDVDMFQAAADKALRTSSPREVLPLLRHAVQLYGGDYFSDDPYTEQWRPARETYRQLFITVTSRLADVYESEGRYEDGIRLLQRLLTEPVRDEGHYRRLMRLQYLHGDQSGALRTFDECRNYLEAEFDADPMPQTLELLKRIARRELVARPEETQVGVPLPDADAPPPADGGPDAGPFLGRTAELGRLQSKLEAVTEGKGGSIWIHGLAGIGKTRLVQRALAQNGDFPGRTLHIEGSRLNQGIPFAALLDCLQTGLTPGLSDEEAAELLAYARQLPRLLGWPPPAQNYPPTAPPEEERFRDIMLRQEFLAFFEALTAKGPLVLWLDRVDSLDTATLGLLATVAKRTDQWPLLVIVTSLAEPTDSEFGAALLTLTPPCSVIPLHPLMPDELFPLVGPGSPGASTEEWLHRLHQATDGEPLMLSAVLRALRTKGLIDFDGDRIVFPSGLVKLITDPEVISSTLQHMPRRDDAFEHEWSHRLEDADRELLQKAASLGDSLTLHRLEALVELDEDELKLRIGRLVRRGYFTLRRKSDADAVELSFNDSGIRWRTYRTMTEPERIWYHRTILELLREEADETLTSSADKQKSPVVQTRLYSALALHALRAEEWEAAAKWSLQATQTARGITPGLEVVALARQAYEAASRVPGAKQLLNEAAWTLANELFHVGSYDEALPLHEELSRLGTLDPAEMSERLVRMYLHFHRIDDAQAVAERTLADTADKRSRAYALLQLGDIYYRRGLISEAIAEGNKALKQFRRANDVAGALLAHRRMGLFYWDLGEYGRAIEHTEKVTEDRAASLEQMLHGLNQLGELYQDIFCIPLAQRIHRKALALAQQHGRIVLGLEISRNIGLNFVLAGHLDQGLELLHQSWRRAQDLNVEPYRREIYLRSLLEATIWAHRPWQVRGLLKQYQDEVGPRETPFIGVFIQALAFLEGRYDEGEATLAQIQEFWHKTNRRAKSAHVLLFVGEELVLRGFGKRGRPYLKAALQELDRIAAIVPPEAARQLRESRQYTATKMHLKSTGDRTG